MLSHIICLLLLLYNVIPSANSSWDDWWTYEGISGSEFWGLLNPEWALCTKGHRQSPINILPEKLLFDPNLQPINIDRHRLSGTIENNGHYVVFKVDNHQNPSANSPNNHQSGSAHNQQLLSAASALPANALNGQLKSADFFSAALAEQSANALLDLQGSSMGLSDPLNQFGASIGDNLHSLTMNAGNSLSNHLALQTPSQSSETNLLNIWGGPLSYTYVLDSLHLHFGRTDDTGSEHQIGGFQFPAEIQAIAYNSDLYQNITEASSKSNGLTAISLLLQIGNNSNSELETLINLAQNVKHRGENVTMKSFSLYDLIPDLTSYLTYDGSLTVPGCYETITWIIVNKPVFITRQQLFILRKLMQGEPDTPKAPLGNNFRPIQSLNGRFVRTNIDFKKTVDNDYCPTMKRHMHYQETDEQNKLRFQIELEFVQCLANPNYLNFLAQRGYLNDKAFINYLKYLKYWKKPEYSKYLKYPMCLHFLDLLQYEHFRKEISNSQCAKFTEDQQLLHWQHYIRKRTKLLQAASNQNQDTQNANLNSSNNSNLVGPNESNTQNQLTSTMSQVSLQ